MTQNLIINNDDDDEFVKFTVEIPDGFSTFKIDSINGTLINQNYLRVGDQLKFTFSNNPITYNTYDSKNGWHYSTTLKMINTTTDMTALDTSEPATTYNFLSLDLFNVYRVKFIPIYSYFDYVSKKFLYLFNPTDAEELRDDPVSDVGNYTLSRHLFDESKNIDAPFAGAFIMALQKVPKIDDIFITFGESISNSKTQFEDLGAINAAGEAVQENLASTSYTYGSAWRYNVSNLIMNHKIMILSNSNNTTTTKLAYFVHYHDDSPLIDEEITTSYANFNYSFITHETEINDETLTFYTISNNNPPSFTPLNNGISLTWMNAYSMPFLKVVSTNPVKFTHVPVDSSATFPKSKLIENGCKIIGTDLTPNNYRLYVLTYPDASTTSIQFIDCSDEFDVKPTAYYSGNVLRLRAYYYNNREVKGKTCTFTDFTQGYKIVPIGFRITTEVNITGEGVKNVYFKFDGDNIGISHVVLGESFTLETNGGFSFVYSINTGYIPSDTYQLASITDYTKQPLQLTSIANDGAITPGDDDILLTHIQDNEGNSGLSLSMPTLTNNIYNVNYDGDGMPTIQTIPPSVSLPPNTFLPMKARQAIVKWQSNFDGSYDTTDGICVLMNQDNEISSMLNDDDSVYFLADGHETLNVEKPRDDDEKFKTFNGSIMFDRSAARITRLFANSQVNSCLGYINDILSAKLSRYYFAADYAIYDAYISTIQKIQLVNSKDQMFNIYKNFSDGTYFNTGDHSVLLCSCFDLVKLIGSDTIVNNCMPSINPEQQRVKCKPLTNDELTEANIKANIEKFEPFKFFHYYNSGFNNYPYFGTGSNDYDNGSTSIGGLSTFRLPDSLFISDNVSHQYAPRATINLNYYKQNTPRATAYLDDVGLNKLKQELATSWTYPSNRQADRGFISCAPIARVYRNANFEQSDLSIATGRMKTLSPIYIQSVSKETIQNLIYMFDMMLNHIISRFCKVSNAADSFNYFGCLYDDSGELPLLSTGVLRRFTTTYFVPQLAEQKMNYNVSFSLDSVLLLNYLLRQSVNDYDDLKALTDSLPNNHNAATTNEEIIADIKTGTFYTNSQLFSSRYFNFFDNITQLSYVNYAQVLTQAMDFPTNVLELYFGNVYEPITEEEEEDEGNAQAKTQISTYIQRFPENISIKNSYNIQRTVKTLISKLGEYLEYPKIIFGTTLDFNNSNTVNIQTLPANKYRSPFTVNYEYRIDPITEQQICDQTEDFINDSQTLKQKQNVAMFGVMFRYHQLSLGWARMDTDIQEQYVITRAKGPKHFTLMLYDEYGREFPNEDTSQGFKNALKLELTLFPG